MNHTYLVKLGELTLKGGNLKEFENRLVQNVQLYLESIKARVTLRAGRMYIECGDEACKAVEFTLSHLIGITGWAKTRIAEKNIESIKNACMEEAKIASEKGCTTFKIDTRRSDKSFTLNSYETSREAGSEIFESGIMSVDVHHPDVTINIEIREKCFIYSDTETGCRGLPVGTSTKGLLLLSGGIDSPVAGYRMMRRGMRVDCCYFHAYPYTSEEAKQKVIDLGKQIGKYGVETNINIIPFTEVQMRIKKLSSEVPMADERYTTESYSTLLLRMCMMKCANLVAKRIHANAIITGESLGQVASQTLENMAVTESCSDFPLLRPLVGMDKEEITETARFIGTYETSILPYEDCCVLFSPKHPVLKAPLETAQKLYEKLDADELIQKAFEKREIVKFLVRDYVEEQFGEKIEKR